MRNCSWVKGLLHKGRRGDWWTSFYFMGSVCPNIGISEPPSAWLTPDTSQHLQRATGHVAEIQTVCLRARLIPNPKLFSSFLLNFLSTEHWVRTETVQGEEEVKLNRKNNYIFLTFQTLKENRQQMVSKRGQHKAQLLISFLPRVQTTSIQGTGEERTALICFSCWYSFSKMLT